MVCDLNFSQIVSHKKELEGYLKTESEGLRDMLAMHAEMLAQNVKVEIDPSKFHIPSIDFNTNGIVTTPEATTAAMIEFDNWITEKTESGTVV